MPAQPPPDRRRYAPLVPSPLNPNTYLNAIKVRQQQQQRQSTLRAKPPNANPSSLPQQYAALAHASPNERLVRQKAAAAWRCETLRHYVLLKPHPGAEHFRSSNHHHLIDFAANPPPTPTSSNPGHSNHGHNNHEHNNSRHNSDSNGPKTKTPPSPPTSPTAQPRPQPSPTRVWLPAPTPYTDHTPNTFDEDISSDIGLGITPEPEGYHDHDNDSNNEGSFPLTSPLLSPTLLLLGGSGSGSGSGSGGMVLPLHGGPLVKKRAGRRRVGGGGSGGGGGVGKGGVGVRRVMVVVALFLGMGLVHGLVSAFGSAGGGGRPPPAER
ncbi:hypothetical protein F5144DRAFT_651256 [Chaetomium tenue]|uniref:Uncharacterized protein n=1 Tax=Chaetomium tenue TaxID=1854479 RepID=A0ACB7P9L3_9PEZI|nr:hypothetical protein F5144DRAFT_651256 [Chaetomium globosum]